MPATAVDSLATRLAAAPASVGCYDRLARVDTASAGLPPPTVWHGCTRRTWDGLCVTTGRLRLHGLHRRSVFAIIARDNTDKQRIDFDLRRRPCHGWYAPVSV